MRNTIKIIIIGSIVSYVNLSQAETLEQTYQLAKQNDPTYAQNRFDNLATQEGLPMAAASYLPQVSLTGSTGIAKATAYGSSNTIASKPRSYGATITQNIFSVTAIGTISQANHAAKAAAWLFKSKQQDLISRTSNAYFAVISDYKALKASQANVAALNSAYQNAISKVNTTGTKLAVMSAKAKLDQAQALNISATAKVKLDVENLRAITDKAITTFDSVGENFSPKENHKNIQELVNDAEKNNALLKSQTQATLAAKANLTILAGNWMPSLSATATFGKSNANHTASNPSLYDKSNAIALNFSMTPFAGGGNFAALKQARYQYESTTALQDFTDKSTINQTRQALLSLNADVDKITADKSSIKSAGTSYTATVALQKAGRITYLDVLQAITAKFTAEQNYQTDVYNYFATKIALQQAIGKLSEDDLTSISKELHSEAIKKPNNEINLCQDKDLKICTSD